VDLVFINLNSVERCGLVTEYRIFKTIIYFGIYISKMYHTGHWDRDVVDKDAGW